MSGLRNGHTCAADGLDLLLGDAGEKLRLDNDGLLGQQALAQHLVVALMDERTWPHTGLGMMARQRLTRKLKRQERKEELWGR